MVYFSINVNEELCSSFQLFVRFFQDLQAQLNEAKFHNKLLQNELNDMKREQRCRRSANSSPSSNSNIDDILDKKKFSNYLDESPSDLDESCIPSSPQVHPKTTQRKRTSTTIYSNKNNKENIKAVSPNEKATGISKGSGVWKESSLSSSSEERIGWNSKASSLARTKSLSLKMTSTQKKPETKPENKPQNISADADLFETEIARTPSIFSTKDKGNTKKRSNLSLNRTTMMKQRKIEFPKVEDVSKVVQCKQEDETYCAGLTPMNGSNMFSDGEETYFDSKLLTSNATKPVKDYDSSVFAISKDTDDIILIEESESTEELFRNIMVKDEDESVLKDYNKQPKKVSPPPVEKKKSTAAHPPARSGCDDCDNWKRLFGDGEPGPGGNKRKQHMCRNQRRNMGRAETPPGFWNPKIPDTPEDEKVETPFDFRFVK